MGDAPLRREERDLGTPRRPVPAADRLWRRRDPADRARQVEAAKKITELTPPRTGKCAAPAACRSPPSPAATSILSTAAPAHGCRSPWTSKDTGSANCSCRRSSAARPVGNCHTKRRTAQGKARTRMSAPSGRSFLLCVTDSQAAEAWHRCRRSRDSVVVAGAMQRVGHIDAHAIVTPLARCHPAWVEPHRLGIGRGMVTRRQRGRQ